MSLRVLTAAEEERRILGTLFLSPATFDLVYVDRGLRPDDFESRRYAHVYAAMAARIDSVGSFDRQTVRQALDAAGKFADAGGEATLDELHDVIPQASLLPDYVAHVRERADRRRLRRMANDVLTAVEDPSKPVLKIAQLAEGVSLEIGHDDRKDSLRHIAGILDAEQENIAAIEAAGGQEITGVPSGFTDLDRLTSGFQKGHLVVIGARPSVGKSAFVTNVAEHAATLGFATALFSLEMPDSEIAQRLMASRARVDMGDLKRGQVGSRWGRVIDANAQLADKPLWIDDTPEITIRQIRAKLRRHAKTNPLDMVIIDYLQLAQAETSPDNRTVAVGDMSRSLKILARELEVPVLLLSQLNRNSENRQDKKPIAADLRESGSIEQDADLILLLHREDRYDPETSRKNVVDVFVPKHRGGPVGDVELHFTGRYARFDDLTPELAA